MTDDQFQDHIEAAVHSGPHDQPPAPDIAGLLRDVAKLAPGFVEWGALLYSQPISDTDSESVYGVRVNRENRNKEWRGMELPFIDDDEELIELDVDDEDRLLGAICAEVESRGWVWGFRPYSGSRSDERKYNAFIRAGRGYASQSFCGRADESACTAILLALRDALREVAE